MDGASPAGSTYNLLLYAHMKRMNIRQPLHYVQIYIYIYKYSSNELAIILKYEK